MKRADEAEAAEQRGGETGAVRIGCVSFLNSKPLIEGLDEGITARHALKLEVPSRLLDRLESGAVDVALCPVIDYFRSTLPLAVVPVGGICCDGPTLTVRLFSPVPVEAIETVHVDGDSHTSVALLRIVLAEAYGITPRFVPLEAKERAAGHEVNLPKVNLPKAELPGAVLLIGDKVVTASPLAVTHPHGLDLGEAWKALTGLPFVFATWIAREDAKLGPLPKELATLRERNAGRIDAIVDRHAAAHGWPRDLARRYLGEILRYRVGERELEAMVRFGELAAKHGLIERVRAVNIRDGGR